MPTVVLVGTLDTKGTEYAWLADRIRERGVDVVLVDAGIVGEPLATPDISRDEVAAAVGADVGALAAAGDRGAAVETMARGAAEIVGRLHAEGRLDAIGGLGGSGGSALVTHAMRTLPVGVPKLMVSTVAGGDVSAYVGVRDIVMMPSIVDISGLNRISREVLARAAGAVCGMVETGGTVETGTGETGAGATEPTAGQERPLVAASMFGNTTTAVEMAKSILEQAGYEVLVFHAVGTGGRTMEGLVEAGLIEGVLDITTTELADELLGGVMSAGPSRLKAAVERGVPVVVAPGCLDMVNFHAPETVPGKFQQRTLYRHNPNVTLLRTNVAENRRLGTIMAEKLNRSTAPATVLIPKKGFSVIGAPGGPFWLPEADQAFAAGLRESLRDDIEVVELDCNINDREFAELCARTLLGHMEARKGR